MAGGNDRLWRSILKRVEKADGPHVQVGVLASKGGSADHDGISMVELAAVHEFGAPGAGIPERSFIRRTFHEKRKELGAITGRLAKQVLTKSLEVPRALDMLGAWGANEVKNTIAKGPHIPPPLKPATIARKGSSRPLVDTGRLLNSIQWEVKRK